MIEPEFTAPSPSAALWAAFRHGLRPDALISVSDWADAHRYLDPATCPEPGRWRTSRTPYLREIMDALGNDDPCERVVFIAGAQVGKSECVLNWIAWCVDSSPCPFLMVQPTVGSAEDFSKGRIAPMVSSTPRLSAAIADPRSRDAGNTTLYKEFPGGFLKIVGANAPIGLASTPIRRLALDEVDRFAADAGGEGDPVALAIQRTANFSNRKILLTSTPTVENESRITKAWLESDQRRYWVPCPDCEEFQTLEWSGVKWEKNAPATARYQCAHCGVLLDNHQKNQMLPRGEWRAGALGDGRTVGYHLSGLYSPHGWRSWENLACEFVEAAGDPARLKVFVNTKLGEVWKLTDEDGIERHGLAARAEPYTAPPAAVEILTAGVDIQDDRIEVEIIGWGAGCESWGIAWHSIQGDPSAPLVWATLDEYLRRKWHTADGRDLAITAAAVDTGGHHTAAAYAFCKGKEARCIWPIKGRGGPGIPIWPRRASRNNKGKVALYILGVDAAKTDVYARLRMTVAGPGYMHTPTSYPPEWYTQVVAERKKTVYHKGFARIAWTKPDHARNEALDCRVYGYAALLGWLSRGNKLGKSAGANAIPPIVPRAETMVAATGPQPYDQKQSTLPPKAAPTTASAQPVKVKRRGFNEGERSYWR